MQSTQKYISDALPVLDKIGTDDGILPTDTVQAFFRIPDGGRLVPFSFEGRKYLESVYNTEARRVLLMSSRQSEKSTSLGNKILIYSILNCFFRSVYVSPTQRQTERFSNDRLADPISHSELLSAALQGGRNTKDNVLYKKFVTGSDVTLAYAYLSADSTRGIRGDLLLIDEFQDLLIELLPVIEQVLSHSKYKWMAYAGTPKSMDNTISFYWENYSTKNEWVIPCDHSGGDYRHWNVVGPRNIGNKGLICAKCGALIDKAHDDAQWVSMRSSNWLKNPPIPIPYEGYRICRAFTPWVEWSEILDARARYTPSKFHNEVLGLAYDAANKPLTRSMLTALSTDISMNDAENYIRHGSLFMGIDWGTGENSYTVVTIAGYLGKVFRYIYFKRFEGEEAEPETTMSLVGRLIEKFKPVVVGTDYGGGHDRNDKLIRQYSLRRIFRYQYVNTKRLYYDKSLARFLANRTECLMALINMITRGGEIALPKWEEIETPFMEDLLSVYSEYSSDGQRLMIQKPPSSTDDTLHSMLYCLLASMIKFPRPDILAPTGMQDAP